MKHLLCGSHGFILKAHAQRLLPQIRKRGNLKTNNTDVRMVAKSEKEAVAVSINSERVKKAKRKQMRSCCAHKRLTEKS